MLPAFRRLNTHSEAPSASAVCDRPNNKTRLVSTPALFRRLNTMDLHLSYPGSPMSAPIHPHTHTRQERCLWRVYANESKTIINPPNPAQSGVRCFWPEEKEKP